MFNRSEIMKEAWRLWNGQFKGRPWLSREFDRERFGWNLKQAWFTAKQAQLTAKERRADSIRAEIDALKYKSFRVNIEPVRQRLERELAAGVSADFNIFQQHGRTKMPNHVQAAAEGMPAIYRRRLLLGMAASTAPVAIAAASPAALPGENPALVAAYDKLVAAKAEHAAATDALEWLADEWRHLWPLAPEEILGGANATGESPYGNDAERNIVGGLLHRDCTVLTKRLSKRFRRDPKWSRRCFYVYRPEYIADRLAGLENREPKRRTDKARARDHAFNTRLVESLKTQLPLSQRYYAETARLREVSGANAARERVTAATRAVQNIEAEIGELPAFTMAGIVIKATALKATYEAHGLQSLGGFLGDSYRLASAIVDVAAAGGAS